jgi:hypothetical protein
MRRFASLLRLSLACGMVATALAACDSVEPSPVGTNCVRTPRSGIVNCQ